MVSRRSNGTEGVDHLFVLHGDELYFSPGYYTRMDSEVALNVYSFNGSRAEHVCEVRHDANAGGSGYPAAAGLLSYRGELVYYALEGTAQTFKMYRGGRFCESLAESRASTTGVLRSAKQFDWV